MALLLHAFGSNGSGQLGIGHEHDVSSPQQCKWHDETQCSPQPPGVIKSIAAGGNHTLVLYEDGRVFGAGDNDSAQVEDVPSAFEKSTFRQIQINSTEMAIDRFTFVSATWTTSILVTDSGVFVRGTGSKGELGLGFEIDSSSIAQRLPDFPPDGTRVVDLKSCMSHTLAVLSDGSVYGWGNGRKGQLGAPFEVVWQPRKIEVSFKAIRAACGRDFSLIAASPEDGRVIVWGSDKYSVVSNAPASLRGWTDLAASWSSLYVLRDHVLTCWGRSDRGQLLGRDFTNIAQIAAGSEHILARMMDDRVLAWGWGEHGNCGPSRKEDKANEISSTARPRFIGAGCATSFVDFGT